jgi:hypothetical protein
MPTRAFRNLVHYSLNGVRYRVQEFLPRELADYLPGFPIKVNGMLHSVGAPERFVNGSGRHVGHEVNP